MQDTARGSQTFFSPYGFGFLLFVVTFALFASSRHFGLVYWDDDLELINNPHLKKLSWDSVVWMFTDLKYLWRYQPFSWLTWFTVYSLFGLDVNQAGPYHWVNVIFHAGNAVLVFLIARSLLSRFLPGKSIPTLLVGALAAGFLWALHPMRVEHVAWVTGMLHNQALFFLFLSFLFYLRHVESPKGSVTWFVASAVAFLFSLFTFPVGIGLVPLLVVLDIYPFRRLPMNPLDWIKRDYRQFLWEKIPFVLLAGIAVVLGLAARFYGPAQGTPLSLVGKILQSSYGWTYYIWKPVFPFYLTPLNTDLVRFNPSEWIFPAALLAVALVMVLFCLGWRRYPGLSVLLAAHFLLLFPMIGLTESPYYPADRYAALPGVVWSIGSIVLLLNLSPVVRRPGIVVLLLFFLFCSWKTQAQLPVWRNTATLYSHLLRHIDTEPKNAAFLKNMGNIAVGVEAPQEAELALDRYLSLHPGDKSARLNHGISLILLSRPLSAYRELSLLVQDSPPNDAWFYLGVSCAHLGNLEEGRKSFSKAMEAEPRNPELHFKVGLCWARNKQFSEALTHVEEAVRLDPKNEQFKKVLAAVKNDLELSRRVPLNK